MKPSKAELLAAFNETLRKAGGVMMLENPAEIIRAHLESLPDEPAPSPEPYAYIAKTIGGGERLLSADDAKQYVERDANLEPLYRHPAPSPASEDHIAGVGKMIAPSPTKPEGLECPAEYAHPFFVYDFMPQKIMFKSDHGDDTMALDVLSVRGWGHLIGHGQAGLKINEQAAAEIQDNFGKWVAKTLTAALFPVSDADTVTLSDLSRIEHAFKAIEEYGNQEALDEMAELIEELKVGVATDNVRVKRADLNILLRIVESLEFNGVCYESIIEKRSKRYPEMADRLRASLNGGAL